MSQSVVKQFFSYGAGYIGATIFSFAAVFFLTRTIAPSVYGQGRLFIVFVSCLYALSNCGLDQSLVRYYFISDAIANRHYLFNKCLRIVILFSCIIAGVVFLCSPLLHLLFKGFFSGFFVCLILTLLVTILNRFLLLFFRMEQSPYIYAIGQISNTFGYFIAVVILYYLFHMVNVHLIVLAYLIGLTTSTLVLWVCKIWYVVHKKNQSKTVVNRPDCYQFKSIFLFGYPFLFSFFLTWCFQSIDRFLLLKFSTYHELGIYSAAFSLIAPIVMLQVVFTTLWSPISMKRMVEDDDGMPAFYSQVFISVFVIMLFAMILFLMAKGVIIHFLGDKYVQASIVLPWLMVTPFFYMLSEITIVGILKEKKTHLNIPVSLFSIIVNIIFCVLLIPRLGAQGAAIALALTYLCYFVSRMFFSFRLFKFDVPYVRIVVAIGLLFVLITLSNIYLMIGLVLAIIVYIFLFQKQLQLISSYIVELLKSKKILNSKV